MDSSGYFVRTRLGHVFFYDWEYFRNHLIEILQEKIVVEIYLALSLAGNSGYQGLASHGAAISIIVAMYYFSKILQNNFTLDFRPRNCGC
jgi:prolipoprotein diacylglyceryltransferase